MSCNHPHVKEMKFSIFFYKYIEFHSIIFLFFVRDLVRMALISIQFMKKYLIELRLLGTIVTCS